MYKIIEEKRTRAINKLTPIHLHPTNILSTMKDLYAQAAYDVDDIWRKTIMEYLIEIGKDQNEFIKILEKIDKAK
jgi:hypothetical protein